MCKDDIERFEEEQWNKDEKPSGIRPINTKRFKHSAHHCSTAQKVRVIRGVQIACDKPYENL